MVWSKDRFKNVEALEREVFQAALWERGIRDTDKLEIHDWISFSDEIFPWLFHDNPEFVSYLTSGYLPRPTSRLVILSTTAKADSRAP